MSNTPSLLLLADQYAAAHAKWALEDLYGASKSYTAEKLRERHAARSVLEKAIVNAPQPVVREPLTPEQVKAIMAEAGYDREAPQPRADFISGLRHGERAHGITQKGGSNAE